jgi:hypothetical protein
MMRATAILALHLIGAHSQTSIKNVVLLGDSYSSGAGARDSSGHLNYDVQSGSCFRSPTTWGAQFPACWVPHMSIMRARVM